MNNFRFFRKFIFIAGIIFLFILVSTFLFIFTRRKNRRKKLVLNCSYFSRLGSKFLGIKSATKNFYFFDKNYLIVSNHLSYLDVLIISSVLPASFITSVEISKDIFLGTLARLGGSLFVERRRKTRLLRDIKSVSAALAEGLNVVLFPEGTSTNGDTILPFKKTLFRSAISCGVEVLPVCIHYVKIDGIFVNKKNRDFVFWYGDMKFLPHFINLMKLKSICASLQFLPAIATASITSDTASKLAYKSIYEAYKKNCHW